MCPAKLQLAQTIWLVLGGLPVWFKVTGNEDNSHIHVCFKLLKQSPSKGFGGGGGYLPFRCDIGAPGLQILPRGCFIHLFIFYVTGFRRTVNAGH